MEAILYSTVKMIFEIKNKVVSPDIRKGGKKEQHLRWMIQKNTIFFRSHMNRGNKLLFQKFCDL